MTEVDNDRMLRLQKASRVHLAMESKKTLSAVKELFPDNPSAMGFFYDRFEKLYNQENESKDLWQGRPVVGTLCVQVPEELIYAAGAVPVRLCAGAFSADQAGSGFMPSRSCPLVKSTLGMAYLKLLPQYRRAGLIVNPTTCDQKRKLGEVAGEFDDRFLTLEVPPTKDSEEARVYWQRVVKRFARRLEQFTGNRITRRGLKGAIAKLSAAQAAFRRLHSLRKGQPVLRGKDSILVMNSYFFIDAAEWARAVDDLVSELEKKASEGAYLSSSAHSPRILLAGSPPIFPNLKLPLLIEELGAVIVADECCSSTRLLYDPVAVDEGFLFDMLPSVADRYLKPCTCPNFTPNTDRQRRLLELARSHGADGVVYNAFSGCQLFEIEARATGRLLEKEGIPMLYVETDYSPEDSGQLSTRIDAFLESIKIKKKRGAR